MKQILFFLLILLFILASCNKKGSVNIENQKLQSAWTLDSIAFDERIHINNDTLKEGMAISLLYQYPKDVPDGVDLKLIQQTFARIFAEDKTFGGTPQHAFEKIKDELKNEALELADSWGAVVNEFGSSHPSFSNYEHLKKMQVENFSITY